jgi:hypothetical protein
MAMVIENRLRLGELAVEPLRGAVVQQELLVDEFHVRLRPKQAASRAAGRHGILTLFKRHQITHSHPGRKLIS